MWFEAIADGLKYKNIPVQLVIHEGSLKVAWRIPNGHKVKVLRHSFFDEAFKVFPPDGDKAASMTTTLLGLIKSHYLLDYPNNDKFLRILRFGLGRVPIVKTLAKRLGSDERKILEGDFCSSLVCRLYSEMGVTLFEGKAPEEISPRGIDKNKSLSDETKTFTIETSEMLRLPIAASLHLSISEALVNKSMNKTALRHEILVTTNEIDKGFNELMRLTNEIAGGDLSLQHCDEERKDDYDPIGQLKSLQNTVDTAEFKFLLDSIILYGLAPLDGCLKKHIDKVDLDEGVDAALHQLLNIIYKSRGRKYINSSPTAYRDLLENHSGHDRSYLFVGSTVRYGLARIAAPNGRMNSRLLLLPLRTAPPPGSATAWCRPGRRGRWRQ